MTSEEMSLVVRMAERCLDEWVALRHDMNLSWRRGSQPSRWRACSAIPMPTSPCACTHASSTSATSRIASEPLKLRSPSRVGRTLLRLRLLLRLERPQPADQLGHLVDGLQDLLCDLDPDLDLLATDLVVLPRLYVRRVVTE